MEYLLQLLVLKDIQSHQDIKVRLAIADDIETLANIRALAFESSLALGRQYVENLLIDTAIKLYAANGFDSISEIRYISEEKTTIQGKHEH